MKEAQQVTMYISHAANICKQTHYTLIEILEK